MKTLDEVIKALEICIGNYCSNAEHDVCPYLGESDMGCIKEPEKDALHYLKEYREMLNTRIYIPEGYTREKTGFTHQDFANTFGEEPHFIRDFMVGTSRNSADTSQKITCPKCHSEFVILPESNDPLTWDELKDMEGEPIWVEQHHGDTKGWLLILRKCDDIVTCTTKHGNSFYLYKANYGEKWQAYRKERTE